MRRLMSLPAVTAAIVLAAGTCAAQAGPAALVGGVDFVSPMGEPVHSPDALSGAEHWFARADADHDGRLTLAEFRADGLRFFATVDVDRDGEIGPAEIDRYETEIAPEIRVTSTGSDPAPSGDSDSQSTPTPYPDRLGAGRYGYIDLPEPIVAMDTNFDRGISQAEFVRAGEQRFTQLDLNHDGAITRDELPKLGAIAGEKRHRRHRR